MTAHRHGWDWQVAARQIMAAQLGTPFDLSVLPRFVYIQHPSEMGLARRGQRLFEDLAAMGADVDFVKSGSEGYTARRHPVGTVLYLAVPVGHDVARSVEQIQRDWGHMVIMDCYFPIMDMASVRGPHSAVMEAIEHRGDIVAALASACAVTTPRPSWSAALVGVNPNSWVLPDIDAPGDEVAFGAIFGQILASAPCMQPAGAEVPGVRP